MGEQLAPEIEIIHPEVEILPADHSEPSSAPPGSRVWLSVDSHGGTRRVYIAKPGPFATFLMVLAFGAIVALSFLVATLLLTVSAVAVTGLVIYGLIRGALNKIR